MNVHIVKLMIIPTRSPPRHAVRPDMQERVLVLSGGDSDGAPLGWMPLDDVSRDAWDSSFARSARALLEAPPPGLGLDAARMRVVKDCMHSLATSKD